MVLGVNDLHFKITRPLRMLRANPPNQCPVSPLTSTSCSASGVMGSPSLIIFLVPGGSELVSVVAGHSLRTGMRNTLIWSSLTVCPISLIIRSSRSRELIGLLR
ncbi:hypothetical protein RRG08_007780 [Elysia crispata]|uniref:Uncharacterized protein n=1 Tax=Elysia crispata TaxID=231223 RepID=A0AAE1E8J4_9GAST|nr:hypothetical protein RRG08_007780 [Elysia crispata]